jgi:hypothetical protein
MDYQEKIKAIGMLLKSKHIALCDIKNIENILLDHIETHKYLINENLPFEVNFEEAIFSWYENVYNPMMREIMKSGLAEFFPMFSVPELFRRVQDHLYYLSVRSGKVVYPDEAVVSFFKLNVRSKLLKLVFKIKNLL